jgi:Flp pilus assembly pilin Flp
MPVVFVSAVVLLVINIKMGTGPDMTHTNKLNIVRRQGGQGMTEYIVIVALVAVAAIGVYSYFGKTVRSDVSCMAKEMSGQSSTSDVATAKGAANQASAEATKNKGLGNYGDGNQAAGGGGK